MSLNQSIAAVIVLTLVVRGGAIVAGFDRLEEDPDGYRGLAENLLQEGVFGWGNQPTAYRPPLYPLLLAPAMAIEDVSNAAVALVHLLLGLATVMAVARLGEWLHLGRYSLLAAALVACDPILLNQSTLVMTETLAALLAVLSLWALTKADATTTVHRSAVFHWLLAGACVGLAALCRPTFLAWLATLPLAIAWRGGSWKEGLRSTAIMWGAAAAVLLPWAVRNQVQLGHPVLATTHGGYTLLLGNNGWFYDHLRRAGWREIWHSTELDESLRSEAKAEVAANRRAYERAWQAMRDDPGMAACASLVRVARFWGVVPYRLSADESAPTRWLRWLVGVWYAFEFMLAGTGVWALGRKLWKSPWCFGWLLAAGFTAVHALYWSDMRMRAPVMPFVALLAAAGGGWIVDWWQGENRDRTRA